MPEPLQDDTAAPPLGAVLAGGRGSRLGGAKPTAELAGRPLLSYPLAALEAAGLETLVVAKRESPLPPLDFELVVEPDQPQHPLCGLIAALRRSAGRPLVALACDMPLVPPALPALLASMSEPLVAIRAAGRIQPFPARYGPALLPRLAAALAERHPLTATLEALSPRLLDADELARFGEPRKLFFNVNDAADLEQAAMLLRGAAPSPPR